MRKLMTKAPLLLILIIAQPFRAVILGHLTIESFCLEMILQTQEHIFL